MNKLVKSLEYKRSGNKKILISLLLVALFNFLVGCYNYETVSVQEFNQILEEDKPNKILVRTKDSQEYNFIKSNFYIQNDTLFGKELISVNEKWVPFEGKISFNEIDEIEYYNTENKWTYRLTISEFARIEKEDKPDEIFLTISDSTRYYFKKDDYYLDNDLFFGKGKLRIADKKESINRELAFSNINSIIFKETSLSWDRKVLWGIGFIAGLFFAITIIWLTDNKKSW